MRVIADFHIHSRYSVAASKSMNLSQIAKFGTMKGLDVIGVGDFTHPKWLDEIKKELVEIDGAGLFKSRSFHESKALFLLSVEVNTVFEHEGSTKKIHHVIMTPNFETAAQVNDGLATYGNLSSDGRPTLKMTASSLVEKVMEISSDNLVFPAHVWTPWFSLFGAKSGFDRLVDCYEDMAKHVIAIETGLSSDPPMNWRLSSLDSCILLSNSDSHSFYPWRIGREANVFDVKKLKYKSILDVIKNRDSERFKFTIETYPAYGKYHWTGHRKCGVSMSGENALRQKNICPKCGKEMAKGVEQRVEELADRKYGYRPSNAIGYTHLLPLSEILATAYGLNQPSSSRVWKAYNLLIEHFGNEYNVLLDTPIEAIAHFSDKVVASTINKVRSSTFRVAPGYDGMYGKMKLS